MYKVIKHVYIIQHLQQWNKSDIPTCMEQFSGPSVPARVGAYYQTTRPHPWRPTLGYENVEVIPL